MKRSAAWRLCSDICFYFAILSLFPSLLPLHGPMALFAAASLLVSLAAVYTPWAPLRLVLSLLPGLAFLHAELSFPLFFLAPAWLYLILTLTAGRFSIWLEGYRRSFRFMLYVCLFVVVSSILLNLIIPGVLLIQPSVCYATAFLCLGVLAMRRMQMNAEMSLGWNLVNGVTVVGVPLLAAGVSLLLWQLLLWLKPLGLRLLPQIRRFLAWLVNTVNALILGDTEVPIPTETPQPTLTPAEEAITEPGWAEPTPNIALDWQPDPALFERARRIGVWLLLILLLVGLLLLVLLRVRRNRARPSEEEFSYEETGPGEIVRKKRKGGRADAPSKAAEVRICYRKYMLLMRRRGVEIRKASTSREILDETGELSTLPAALRLRELYLKARYDDGRVVTEEDVLEALRCLEEIREEKAQIK